MSLKHKLRFSTFQVILLSFLGLISVGVFLLMLPVSTYEEGGASFADALFTSVSAVCVTGLVVQNTATYWTFFGKCVILCLIQIGGLGVVTVSVIFASILERKIGLRHRTILQEAISADQLGGIVTYTHFIVKTVLFTEGLGALCLYPVFFRKFGALKGLGYAVFHSISAFCNAGIDLMGEEKPFSSLTAYTGVVSVNMVIMVLILAGGIGFGTLKDIKKNKWDFRRYRLESKLVLTTSTVLLVLPFIYFYFGEFGDYPLKERILASAFQTVTPRTAGFSTVDLSTVSESGILVMIILMLVGGATGSTAGGMKMTTVSVLIVSSFATFIRRKEAVAFHRRIAPEIVHNASAIFFIYQVFFIASALIISKIESLPILSCMFETASAIATVGISLGITTRLSIWSRCILMFLMFFGRVGGLTIIYAAISKSKQAIAKPPQEAVSVG